MSLQPTTVFLVSYGRPLYLAACLDALYRLTRTPARFVLLDNWHPDPEVSRVIESYERLGLFWRVHRFPTNSVANLRSAYLAGLDEAGTEHVFMESDAVVSCDFGCWLAEMLRIYRSAPEIGMLGSLLDTSDFVAEKHVMSLAHTSEQRRFLIKADSPERHFQPGDKWHSTGQDFFFTTPPSPITNPPGRLLMLRTATSRRCGLLADGHLAAHYVSEGFHPAVTARVRHRHLSLRNIFDYPEYDGGKRDAFFDEMACPAGGNAGMIR